MNRRIRRRGYLRQAWLVIILAFVYGGALAGIQTTLAPRIAENKRQETFDVVPLLIPDADAEQTVEHEVATPDGKTERVYEVRDAGGERVGWVVNAVGQGFADRIELLIGLDDKLTSITGLYVLDQKETPGLGDYIRDRMFCDRFQGKPTDPPLIVVKEKSEIPHQVEALSGATVSSQSVVNIVNDAVSRLRAPLEQID